MMQHGESRCNSLDSFYIVGVEIYSGFCYDKNDMLSETDITTRIRPGVHLHLIDAVMQAITLGYKQETANESETETDLGLLELQKKEVAGI